MLVATDEEEDADEESDEESVSSSVRQSNQPSGKDEVSPQRPPAVKQPKSIYGYESTSSEGPPPRRRQPQRSSSLVSTSSSSTEGLTVQSKPARRLKRKRPNQTKLTAVSPSKKQLPKSFVKKASDLMRKPTSEKAMIKQAIELRRVNNFEGQSVPVAVPAGSAAVGETFTWDNGR